jgi:hypothetical protein
MPAYYSVGNRLLTEEMLVDRRSTIVAKVLGDDAARARLPDLTPAWLKKADGPAVLAVGGGEADFKPTGVGRPLAIWIASAYAGNLGGSFFRAPNVLVSSAVKSWVTPGAQPRALNILKAGIGRNQQIGQPSAMEEGTPLVFYSPAAIDRNFALTVEMAFDNVNEDLLKGVGRVFGAAGGLPVFASASPYLLAASALFNIGGALGNRLFDSKAEFSGTEQIQLVLEGGNGFAGYVVLTRTPLEASDLEQNAVQSSGRLMSKDGKPYSGDVPHVVVAMNGRPEPSFEKFSGAAVGAALLEKFYNIRTDGQTDASMMIDALNLYNDFRFRKEAADLDKAIGAATTDDERQAIQRRRDALIKNIKTDLFRPS